MERKETTARPAASSLRRIRPLRRTLQTASPIEHESTPCRIIRQRTRSYQVAPARNAQSVLPRQATSAAPKQEPPQAKPPKKKAPCKLNISESDLNIALLALKNALPELTAVQLKALLTMAKTPAAPMPEEDRLITVKEAARKLGVSRRTLDHYISLGYLRKQRLSYGGRATIGGKSRQVGGTVRLRYKEVQRIVEGGLLK